MKLSLLVLLSVIALTGCQKAADEVKALAKPLDKPAPVVNPKTVSTLECTSKEVIKYISEKDGAVTHKTFEEKVKSINTSTLTSKNGNVRSSNISGELVIEGFVTDNDGVKTPSTKVDYTSLGTRVSTTLKVDAKTVAQQIKREVVKTGRNGYQFNNPDHSKTDTKKESSVVDATYFDDGETFYYLKYEGVINGKKGNYVGVLDTIQHYKTEGKVTKSVTTLKDPRVVKNAAGVVIEETESYEENCTETAE